MKRRKGFNTKRRLSEHTRPGRLQALAATARYGGNPEHKRNPGDFGLIPPACPRPHKTLCDDAGIFSRDRAVELLKAGILRGLVSGQERNGWPQNVWAVTVDGQPLEAELENPGQGVYHGYPMPEADPFRETVLARWKAT
jgi:hypothetical protein